MINNEMITVTHIIYSSTPNSYGQLITTESQKSIKMMTKPYSQTFTGDPRFNEVELIGLTDSEVSEGDGIQIGTVKYKVMNIVHSRHNRVLLQRQ